MRYHQFQPSNNNNRVDSHVNATTGEFDTRKIPRIILEPQCAQSRSTWAGPSGPKASATGAGCGTSPVTSPGGGALVSHATLATLKQATAV